MKVQIGVKGNNITLVDTDSADVELRQVYNGVTIHTQEGSFGICQRGDGIEVTRDGELVFDDTTVVSRREKGHRILQLESQLREKEQELEDLRGGSLGVACRERDNLLAKVTQHDDEMMVLRRYLAQKCGRPLRDEDAGGVGPVRFIIIRLDDAGEEIVRLMRQKAESTTARKRLVSCLEATIAAMEE